MDSIPDINVLLAAYCKAADPALTQQQIGVVTNLGTQAQVSRLLADARLRGYLHEVFEFPQDMPRDTRDQLRRRFEQAIFKPHADLEAALIKKAEELCGTRFDGGSPFKRLHVVPAPALRDGDDKAREEAFSAFGANAAEIVASYIDEADSCCVAWGRTINATVRHIRSRAKPTEHKKTFMPIAGEPTNFEPNGVSPSDAARTLANAWRGSRALSLRGVQARIPKEVYDHDKHGIALELASYSDDYRQIFGKDSPLIDRVAMILTGIGDVRTSSRADERPDQADPWYLETAQAEKSETAEAGDPDVLGLAVGNLGGVWLPKDEDDRDKVEQVNDRWLGARHRHFRRCSLNAVPGQRPGVVVLAVEPEKAGIILEALYLVNVLVVSRELAEKLAGVLLGERG